MKNNFGYGEDMKSTKDFIKIIRKRNIREWIACVIVIPTFFSMGLNKETNLSKFLCFEIALAALFIAYYIYIKSHQNLKKAVETNMNQTVRNEINLLLNIRYWYVLPIFSGLLGLVVEELYIGFRNHRSLIGGLISFILLLGFGVFIVYLNEKKGVQDLESFLKN